MSRGAVYYGVAGDYPNREFVVGYSQLEPINDGTQFLDAQVKLFETTNVIEIHVST